MLEKLRSNENWIESLSSDGFSKNTAIEELREILVWGLERAFKGTLSKKDREFSEMYEDFAQEALIKIIENLNSFQGNAKFTTWAYKICIRIAFAELRRLRWKDVSLDEMLEMGNDPSVEQESAKKLEGGIEMQAWIQVAMAEELSEKQRVALYAVAFKQMPIPEVAKRLGTNNNALYKLLHDARIKLKSRMMQDGLMQEVG